MCVCVFGIGLKVSDKRHRENPVQAKQSACCISVCDRCGDRVCVVIRDGGGGGGGGMVIYVDIGPAVLILDLTAEVEEVGDRMKRGGG